MGTFLAGGVVTSISVKKRKNFYECDDFDLKKEKPNIIKGLNEWLDMDIYKLKEYEEGFYFEINKQFFEENIHDLVNEFDEIRDCRYLLGDRLFGKEKITKESFNNENYPLELYKNKDNGAMYLKSEKDEIKEEYPFYPAERMLFQKDEYKQFFYGLDVTLYYIPIWFDWNKIISEDETSLLYLLNYFSRDKLTCPLAKNLLFYISG